MNDCEYNFRCQANYEKKINELQKEITKLKQENKELREDLQYYIEKDAGVDL